MVAFFALNINMNGDYIVPLMNTKVLRDRFHNGGNERCPSKLPELNCEDDVSDPSVVNGHSDISVSSQCDPDAWEYLCL